MWIPKVFSQITIIYLVVRIVQERFYFNSHCMYACLIFSGLKLQVTLQWPRFTWYQNIWLLFTLDMFPLIFGSSKWQNTDDVQDISFGTWPTCYGFLKDQMIGRLLISSLLEVAANHFEACHVRLIIFMAVITEYLDCMLNHYLHWYQTICVAIVCIWLGKEMVTKANKLLYILRGVTASFFHVTGVSTSAIQPCSFRPRDGEQRGASRSWWDSLCLHPTVISIDSSVLLSPCL